MPRSRSPASLPTITFVPVGTVCGQAAAAAFFAGSNAARTILSRSMTSVHVRFAPEQSPPQLTKREPGVGSAVRVTWVPPA